MYDRRFVARLAFAFLFVLMGQAVSAQWISQESGTKSRFRGLSVVSDRVAWASGTKGTVVVTTDGGTTWKIRPVPGASDLDFRDVHAVDARVAWLLSIGEAEKSRIYKTTDGGENWTLQYTNPDPKGFLDAIAFWDADHGIALGDPVDGRYTILTTEDGGKAWTKGGVDGMPPALAKEGAFAASGTCLVTFGVHDAWFGTGGGKTARVFHSGDRGKTWTAHDTPIRAGSPTAGVFSLAFRDANHGVIVGGFYDQPKTIGRVAATTEDGGRTWKLAENHGPGGFRSAVAFVGPKDSHRLIAVGLSGSDFSTDDGQTWRPLGAIGFHAVGFSGPESGWAVGDDGRIAKYSPKAEK